MYRGTHITKERLHTYIEVYIPHICKNKYLYILDIFLWTKTFSFTRSDMLLSLVLSSSFYSVIYKLPIFPIPIHSSTLLLLFYHPSFLQSNILSCLSPVLSPPSTNGCWLFVSCIFVRGVYPFLSMECHLKSFSIIRHKLEYYNIRISKGCEMNEWMKGITNIPKQFSLLYYFIVFLILMGLYGMCVEPWNHDFDTKKWWNHLGLLGQSDLNNFFRIKIGMFLKAI